MNYLGLKENEIRKKRKIVLSRIVNKDLKVIMEEDCAETPRRDDITYCQNFNKKSKSAVFHSSQGHSKAEPEKGAALFIAITRVRLKRKREGMSFAEHV